MYKCKYQQSGFNLTELIIAMALSLILILGITTVFASLKKTATYSQQLESTQEVLRFTSSIFSHGIHRANDIIITQYIDTDGNSHDQLNLTFDLGNLDTGESYTSCLNNEMSNLYYESYRLIENELHCTDYITVTLDETVDPFTAIGTNIDALSFAQNNNLLTVSITPSGETNFIDMIFAQRQAILGLN
jgi:prepilin-type N-terminal cleavage/methylation domain-containing protein